MKKSLLALAVLTAVTGAAYAQSSVTIYGKVDLGLTYDSGNAGGKSIRVDSGVTGGSRLGFKGVEDLGGGYKAAFQLETGYCADSAAPVVSNGASVPNFCTGSNNLFGRQAHGDLSGAFGAMSAGRQYSLGFNNLTTIDPFGTGFAGQVNNIVDPSNIRINNSFTYTTPSFAGLTASGEIGFGEQVGNWKKSRETGGAVTYASGPAYAGFTFYDADNANGVGSARKNYLLGGTYDFGVVKIHALAQKSNGNPTGLTSLNVLDWMGGVTVPVLGGNILASYIHHNDKSIANHDASQAGVGYIYPLSKRTSVYTAFAKINNQHGALFTVGTATDTGTGDKAFNLGVVHNF
jgi:predicted porin